MENLRLDDEEMRNLFEGEIYNFFALRFMDKMQISFIKKNGTKCKR